MEPEIVVPFREKDRSSLGVRFSRGDLLSLVGTIPEVFDDQTVQMLRKRLGHSKHSFAKLLRVSLSILDKWEVGHIVTKGPALIVLQLLWAGGEKRIRIKFRAGILSPARRLLLLGYQDTVLPKSWSINSESVPFFA